MQDGMLRTQGIHVMSSSDYSLINTLQIKRHCQRPVSIFILQIKIKRKKCV